MTADRIVMLAIIAALVVERLWGVPEPAPTKHEAKAQAEHAYLPARMYVRRCVGEGKDFVLKQADGGPWQATCVDARLGMPL
jgi:hypothetical protein